MTQLVGYAKMTEHVGVTDTQFAVYAHVKHDNLQGSVN